MENWIPIEGYEGLYEVSDLGNVRSLTRIVKTHHNGKQPKQGCNLIKSKDSRGYPIVTLCKTGKQKTVRIHRLVALCFIGPPGLSDQVNHINGKKDDNSVANLEWCNASENMKHSFRLGLQKPVRVFGIKNGRYLHGKYAI